MRSRFPTRFTFAIRDHDSLHDSHSRFASAIAYSRSQLMRSAFAFTITIRYTIRIRDSRIRLILDRLSLSERKSDHVRHRQRHRTMTGQTRGIKRGVRATVRWGALEHIANLIGWSFSVCDLALSRASPRSDRRAIAIGRLTWRFLELSV